MKYFIRSIFRLPIAVPFAITVFMALSFVKALTWVFSPRDTHLFTPTHDTINILKWGVGYEVN